MSSLRLSRSAVSILAATCLPGLARTATGDRAVGEDAEVVARLPGLLWSPVSAPPDVPLLLSRGGGLHSGRRAW